LRFFDPWPVVAFHALAKDASAAMGANSLGDDINKTLAVMDDSDAKTLAKYKDVGKALGEAYRPIIRDFVRTHMYPKN